MKFIQVLTCLVCCGVTNSAKILAVFPFPAPSHHRVFQPILKELSLRGHDVTAYLGVRHPDPPPTNFKEVVLPNYIEIARNQSGFQLTPFIVQLMNWKLLHGPLVRHMGLLIGEAIYNSDALQSLINSNEKYDVILLSSLSTQEPLLALRHKFNAPVVDVYPSGNSMWIYWWIGNPMNPSYVLDYLTRSTDHMNLWERMTNIIVPTVSIPLQYIHLSMYETQMNKYFKYPGWETRPPLTSLMSNTDMVLMNTHYSINYPYPLAPHVKEIGGINIVLPVKPLPHDLQQFMDEAQDGVVYFSLGSFLQATDMIHKDTFESLIKAFGKLKQKVLFKWESDDTSSLPPNVLTSKWFPQQSILAHKNIKLFITHCGFLSTSEAVYFAVPLIMIPLAADQHKNAISVINKGFGIELSLSNITEESISWAIHEVLYNPRYKKEVELRSALFRDRPQTPLETAIQSIEHVIKYKGANHLKPAIRHLRWYQIILLDVFAIYTVIIFAVVFSLILITQSCYRYLFCRGKNSILFQAKKQV